ncbi:threonine-phosphate decarboxylase [Bacillus sp. A301a_S52]|jgi:threonine-phosphate decarboxylase|nr:threonine-phosphate decarboxylase [Bacillus sp. A301a_S52]
MNWPEHGGQPAKVGRHFNSNETNKSNWLDFSANIYPFGPPKWVETIVTNSMSAISVYPDPEYEEPTKRLATLNNLSPKQVLITNGGAEAIFLTAKLFEGKRALIVQPTFVEYEQACLHYGIETQDVFYEDGFRFPLEELESQMTWADVVYVCRPNNPSGTVISKRDIRVLLERCEETETYLVVDEAFADFLPEGDSILTGMLAQFKSLILLRSLTKMYSIPGLRIGYLLASPTLIAKLRRWQMPWSVNGIAGEVVKSLPIRDPFVNEARTFVKEELVRVRERLTELRFDMSPSQVNFFLLYDLEAPNKTEELFAFLAKNSIIARHTHNFKGLNGHYLRFAIKSAEDNDKLLACLAAWRNHV